MKIAPCLLILAAVVMAASFSTAQEPAKPLLETKVVLRVSRHFIHRLIGVGFRHNEPIDSNAGGVMTQGNALAEGKIDVKLHESERESDFDLAVTGDVSTQIAATRRPLQIGAHGIAPFSACRRVVLRDDIFSALPLSIEVHNQFSLDDIRTVRGRPVGPLARGIVRPFVRRGLADGDRQAEDQIRTQLGQSLGEPTDKLVTVLNKVKPFVDHGVKLLVEKKVLPADGLHFYHAATKEHLLLSIGRPDHRIPTLLEGETFKHAPVELWIAKGTVRQEELRRYLKEHWRDIQPLILDQIRRRSPEVAKKLDGKLEQYLKDVDMEESDGWHVVTFAPKLHLHLVVDIP